MGNIIRYGLIEKAECIFCVSPNETEMVAEIKGREVFHVPNGVDLEDAAFAGLGAIVINSVRLARPEIGSTLAILGTGLLGLIAVQVAKAIGCSVLAIDISPTKLKLAKELGADEIALVKGDDYSEVYEKAMNISDGYGVDATIIFAATKSNKPLEVAAEITSCLLYTSPSPRDRG